MAGRVNPSTVAAAAGDGCPLLADEGLASHDYAVPLTPEIYDAAARLAECLRSSFDARVPGPQIVARSPTVPGAGLREPPCGACHSTARFGQIARALVACASTTRMRLMQGACSRSGISISTFTQTSKRLPQSLRCAIFRPFGCTRRGCLWSLAHRSQKRPAVSLKAPRNSAASSNDSLVARRSKSPTALASHYRCPDRSVFTVRIGFFVFRC